MTVARSLRARMPLRLNLALSASYILGDTSTRPSMEAKESCKLTEAMLIGLAASNIIRAKDMLVSGSGSLLNINASILSNNITQALTMALEQPIISVKTIISGMPMSDALRRPASITTAAQRKLRCIPETDMTCESPVVARALSSS